MKKILPPPILKLKNCLPITCIKLVFFVLYLFFVRHPKNSTWIHKYIKELAILLKNINFERLGGLIGSFVGPFIGFNHWEFYFFSIFFVLRYSFFVSCSRVGASYFFFRNTHFFFKDRFFQQPLFCFKKNFSPLRICIMVFRPFDKFFLSFYYN